MPSPFHAPSRLAVLLLLVATAAACAVAGPADDQPSPPDAAAAPTVDTEPSTLATTRYFDTFEDSAILFGLDARDADGSMRQLVTRPPLHGALTCDGITCRYTPRANFHGHDNLAVAIGSGDHQAVSTIEIAVAAVNDAPVPQPDAFSMVANTELEIPTQTLLANDTDVDGDALAVSAVGTALHGKVTATRGVIAFRPDAGFVGEAGFAYAVTDGFDTVLGHATVQCYE